MLDVLDGLVLESGLQTSSFVTPKPYLTPTSKTVFENTFHKNFPEKLNWNNFWREVGEVSVHNNKEYLSLKSMPYILYTQLNDLGLPKHEEIDINVLKDDQIWGLKNIMKRYYRHSVEQLMGFMFPKSMSAEATTLYLIISPSIRGSFAKRVSKYMFKEHGVKLDNSLIEEIGTWFGHNSISPGSAVKLKIWRKPELWEPGQFGDPGSCFWGEYSMAVDNLKNSGWYPLVWYTDGKLQTSNTILLEEDGKVWSSSGRAWILPEYPNKEEFLLINPYMKDLPYEDLLNRLSHTLKYTIHKCLIMNVCVSEYFNEDWQDYTNDYMFFNGGTLPISGTYVNGSPHYGIVRVFSKNKELACDNDIVCKPKNVLSYIKKSGIDYDFFEENATILHSMDEQERVIYVEIR